MGREVEIPRTPPGGNPVPDGTVLEIFKLTDLITPVASPVVTGGKVDYQYDGSFGPIEQRMTYAGETRKRDSRVRGHFGPLSGGEVSSMLAALGPGVVRGLRNDLAVVSGAPGRRVYVRSGVGQAAGVIYSQYTDNLQSVEFATNVSGLSRIDLIGFEVYTPGHAREGEAALAILAGTPAATPVAPTPTQTYESGTWFEPLSQVTLASGYSSISAGNIADVRRSVSPRQPGGVTVLGPDSLVTWAVPAGEMAWGNVVAGRGIFTADLSRATEFRIMAYIGSTVPPAIAGTVLRLKVGSAHLSETDNAGDLSIAGASAAIVVGSWTSIRPSFRSTNPSIVTYGAGGDAVKNPAFGNIRMEYR